MLIYTPIHLIIFIPLQTVKILIALKSALKNCMGVKPLYTRVVHERSLTFLVHVTGIRFYDTSCFTFDRQLKLSYPDVDICE